MEFSIMPRATGVIAAKHRHGRPVSDTLILGHEERNAAKVTVTSARGATIEIDLIEPARLRTDDLLLLDDGTFVEVVAAPEPLIEARAVDDSELARLAWHLGDRHIAAELLPNRIRVQRKPATEILLTSLAARVAMIEAPFEPEGGAYAAPPVQGRDHHHGHDHGHDHTHEHDHDRSHRPRHG